MDISILFLVFNRPEATRRVFEAIKKVKPTKLFVAADGPRNNRPDDIPRCEEVKKIIDGVDWKCELKTLYRKENLGCRVAVSSAIDWFFENVEEGIILEDDCLPDGSFFDFCSYLLEKYRDNDIVMHIGGNNFQKEIVGKENGYYFSKYPHIWGWATWKRAWQKYVRFENLSRSDKLLGSSFYYFNLLEKLYWVSLFWCVKNKLINTWDFQWVYSIWLNKGVCIAPTNNLVINVGIGKDSTNTSTANNSITRLKLKKVGKLHFKEFISTNEKADCFTLQNVFGVKVVNILRIILIIPYYLINKIKNV